ncbi:periplasmic heavy metal sensor [Thalassotalea litorea]|uniref:Periplasmic heavy metal sensor n=1 Tax=Thalassotalea litorea TaxID=2020715 RepID=A0A5R9IV21_9GAMM|nr:Spy/CpxP family protein refolding chaperone [Thalassotalea litorea]TLU65798.1 periplasmic heavy metal sensor [Thalassotalea litorea]
MTRTRTFNTSVLLVLLSSLAFSSMAFDKSMSKGDRGGKSQQMTKMFRALDLTEAQKSEIKTIRESSKQQLHALAPNKDENRKELQAIIRADTFNEDAFMALQQSTQEQKQQAELIKAKTMHQIYHVLDSEQQVKFEKMQQERKQRK